MNCFRLRRSRAVSIWPNNSSESEGATRRVARTEFGVKGNRSLLLTLGT